eukprot:TRINITY_DN1558_c0_g1_i1.p1 TRINITY_DN1558_c0_g1~~TRINITY_DN1558_c0_g1_i1.p1  ORF type:complete len:1518 (-),score=423.20 TRINITY_DN1558_c0_g1_i1:216-4220(-)
MGTSGEEEIYLDSYKLKFEMSVSTSEDIVAIKSPLYPVKFTEGKTKNSGKITLEKVEQEDVNDDDDDGVYPDADIVLFIHLNESLELPKFFIECSGESSENEKYSTAIMVAMKPDFEDNTKDEDVVSDTTTIIDGVGEDDRKMYSNPSREILFVVDPQGEEKFNFYKSAIRYSLTTITNLDHISFNIVVLSKHDITVLFEHSKSATSTNIDLALQFIDSENFDTACQKPHNDLEQALSHVYELEAFSSTTPRVMLLIGNGQKSRSNQLLAFVDSRWTDFRIFPLCIGNNGNSYLLHSLAKMTAGSAKFIYRDTKLIKSRFEKVVEAYTIQHMNRIITPFIENISLQWKKKGLKPKRSSRTTTKTDSMSTFSTKTIAAAEEDDESMISYAKVIEPSTFWSGETMYFYAFLPHIEYLKTKFDNGLVFSLCAESKFHGSHPTTIEIDFKNAVVDQKKDIIHKLAANEWYDHLGLELESSNLNFNEFKSELEKLSFQFNLATPETSFVGNIELNDDILSGGKDGENQVNYNEDDGYDDNDDDDDDDEQDRKPSVSLSSKTDFDSIFDSLNSYNNLDHLFSMEDFLGTKDDNIDDDVAEKEHIVRKEMSTIIIPTEKSEDDSNSNNRIQYSIDFLLSQKELHTNLPEGSSLEVLIPLTEKKSESKSVSSSSSSSSKSKAKDPSRAKSKKAVSSRRRQLHKTRAKLEVQTQWDKDNMSEAQYDELFRNVNSLLNRLALPNFNVILSKILAYSGDINSVQALKGIVEIVFEKALSSPSYAMMYAELCSILSKSLPEFEINQSKPMSFRRLLINFCQHEFEHRQESRINPSKHVTPEDILELEFRQRLRHAGNITFVGELFKKNLIGAHIIERIIDCMIMNGDVDDDSSTNNDGGDGENTNQDKEEESLPTSQNIELTVKLITTMGKSFDSIQKSVFFNKLELLSKDKRVDQRLRCLIQELLDLNNNNWMTRKELKLQQEKLNAKKLNSSAPNGRKSPLLPQRRPSAGNNNVNSSSNSRGNSPNQKLSQSYNPPRGGSKSSSPVNNAPSESDRLSKHLSPSWRSREADSSPSFSKTRSRRMSNDENNEDQQHNSNDVSNQLSSSPSKLNKDSNGSPPSKSVGIPVRSNLEVDKEDKQSPSSSPTSSSPLSTSPRTSPQKMPFDIEEIESKIEAFIEEFLDSEDVEAAHECYTFICDTYGNGEESNLQKITVSSLLRIMVMTVEGNERNRRVLPLLLKGFHEADIFNPKLYTEGLTEMFSLIPDIVIDIPHGYIYLGNLVSTLIQWKVLAVDIVYSTLKSSPVKIAAKIASEIVLHTSKTKGKEEANSIADQLKINEYNGAPI